MGVSRPAYVHSFGMSERYLVLAEFPFVVNPIELALSGRAYIENYKWEPERGGRLHVFERSSGRLHRTYEVESGFSFHHVNAWEEDGELVCDLLRHDDPSVIDLLYLDRAREGVGEAPPVRLRRYRMDLGSERVRERNLSEQSFELPRIHPERVTKPYRWVWGTATSESGAWTDQIVKVDAETGEVELWSEPGSFPGEPIFVPAAGGRGEDEGVLLSVVLDSERETSYLLVLDAQTLAERARARVPHQIPFHYHGMYADGV
jgi:carotenoid cleavage dioxygenase-like enzyme